MSGVDVNAVLEKAKELDQLRKDQEEVVAEINKIHKKLQSSPDIIEKPGDAILQKLRALYVNAKDLAENEVSVSAALMTQLDALLLTGMSAAQRRKIVGEQKRKRMKSDNDASRPPSTSMRNQLEHLANLKGEQVAAMVSCDDDRNEWFVVKVIHFDRETKEFEVLDEDPADDDESVQKKYKVPMSHIIPFPKRNDPSNSLDFAANKHVLAVYPGTTALYKATVVNQRKKKNEDYLLEFDDDEEEDGSLPQRSVPYYRVVPLPEGHRQ